MELPRDVGTLKGDFFETLSSSLSFAREPSHFMMNIKSCIDVVCHHKSM